MSSDLSLEFLRVVEQAAIACAHTMGQGDGHKADQAAVDGDADDARQRADSTERSSSERESATRRRCCTSAKPVGTAAKEGGGGLRACRRVDIAVDPLEGTNLCATGAPNALAVLAASNRGGLLHAPDLYMEKLVVGVSSKNAVSLDAPVADNLRAIAKCLHRDVEDLVVIVLDRPRHEQLIQEIRATGARIRLISDGDLSAGIAAAVDGSGVHAVMGTGGAPEGVITAAAMRCLNGEIFARLVVTEARARRALPGDGHYRFPAHLHLEGPGVRRRPHLRGDRRHRRHTPQGRPVLWRRYPHRRRSSCRPTPRASGSSTPSISSSRGVVRVRF